MMWVMAVVVYLIGASIMVRRRVLRLHEWEEQLDDCINCNETYYCDQHGSEKYRMKFAVVWLSLIWPLALVAWSWWRMLFPFGVRTPASIEKAKEEMYNARVAELTQQAERIKELSRAAGLRIPEGL
jgi:hypothetical protein